MTDYDDAVESAMDALTEASTGRDRTWTRAERLAEAQVHATLAVAAAVLAGLAFPQRYVTSIDDAIPAHAAGTVFRDMDATFAKFDAATTFGRAITLPDAFTGSERAGEVGA